MNSSGRHELSESSSKVSAPCDSGDVKDVAVVTVWRQMLCRLYCLGLLCRAGCTVLGYCVVLLKYSGQSTACWFNMGVVGQIVFLLLLAVNFTVLVFDRRGSM